MSSSGSSQDQKGLPAHQQAAQAPLPVTTTVPAAAPTPASTAVDTAALVSEVIGAAVAAAGATQGAAQPGDSDVILPFPPTPPSASEPVSSAASSVCGGEEDGAPPEAQPATATATVGGGGGGVLPRRTASLPTATTARDSVDSSASAEAAPGRVVLEDAARPVPPGHGPAVLAAVPSPVALRFNSRLGQWVVLGEATSPLDPSFAVVHHPVLSTSAQPEEAGAQATATGSPGGLSVLEDMLAATRTKLGLPPLPSPAQPRQPVPSGPGASGTSMLVCENGDVVVTQGRRIRLVCAENAWLPTCALFSQDTVEMPPACLQRCLQTFPWAKFAEHQRAAGEGENDPALAGMASFLDGLCLLPLTRTGAAADLGVAVTLRVAPPVLMFLEAARSMLKSRGPSLPGLDPSLFGDVVSLHERVSCRLGQALSGGGNCELSRLRALRKRPDLAIPHVAEFAEAGFLLHNNGDNELEFRHFEVDNPDLSVGLQPTAPSDRAFQQLARHSRRFLDHTSAAGRWSSNVPRSVSISSQPAIDLDGNRSTAPVEAVLELPRAGLAVVVCGTDGTTSLWRHWPELEHVASFNSLAQPGDAASPSSGPKLVLLHAVEAHASKPQGHVVLMSVGNAPRGQKAQVNLHCATRSSLLPNPEHVPFFRCPVSAGLYSEAAVLADHMSSYPRLYAEQDSWTVGLLQTVPCPFDTVVSAVAAGDRLVLLGRAASGPLSVSWASTSEATAWCDAGHPLTPPAAPMLRWSPPVPLDLPGVSPHPACRMSGLGSGLGGLPDALLLCFPQDGVVAVTSLSDAHTLLHRTIEPFVDACFESEHQSLCLLRATGQLEQQRLVASPPLAPSDGLLLPITSDMLRELEESVAFHRLPVACVASSAPARKTLQHPADEHKKSPSVVVQPAALPAGSEPTADLTISLKLAAPSQIFSIRIECDLAQSSSPSGPCLVAVSSLRASRPDAPIVHCHTFSIRDQASKKVQDGGIRYKATIRSTPLSRSPSSVLRLTFLRTSPEGVACSRPTAVSLTVFGRALSRSELARGATALPRAVLEPAAFPQFVRALLRCLGDAQRPFEAQRRAQALVTFVVNNTKRGGAAVTEHIDFVGLFRTGIILNPDPVAARQLAAFLRTLVAGSRLLKDKAYHAAAGLLEEAWAQSPSLAAMAAFFDVFAAVVSAKPSGAMAKGVSVLLSAARLLAAGTDKPEYVLLREHYGREGLVFEDGALDCPTDTTPECTVALKPLPEGPSRCLPIHVAACRGPEQLALRPPDRARASVTSWAYELEFAPSTHVLLDFGAERDVAEVFVRLPAGAPACSVKILYCLTSARKLLDVSLTLLSPAETKEATEGFVTRIGKPQRPLRCQFVALELLDVCATGRSGSGAQAPDVVPADPFQTPPGGVGYVHTQIDGEGKLVATPTKPPPAHQPMQDWQPVVTHVQMPVQLPMDGAGHQPTGPMPAPNVVLMSPGPMSNGNDLTSHLQLLGYTTQLAAQAQGGPSYPWTGMPTPMPAIAKMMQAALAASANPPFPMPTFSPPMSSSAGLPGAPPPTPPPPTTPAPAERADYAPVTPGGATPDAVRRIQIAFRSCLPWPAVPGGGSDGTTADGADVAAREQATALRAALRSRQQELRALVLGGAGSQPSDRLQAAVREAYGQCRELQARLHDLGAGRCESPLLDRHQGAVMLLSNALASVGAAARLSTETAAELCEVLELLLLSQSALMCDNLSAVIKDLQIPQALWSASAFRLFRQCSVAMGTAHTFSSTRFEWLRGPMEDWLRGPVEARSNSVQEFDSCFVGQLLGLLQDGDQDDDGVGIRMSEARQVELFRWGLLLVTGLGPKKASSSQVLSLVVADSRMHNTFFRIKSTTALSKVLVAYCERHSLPVENHNLLYNGLRLNLDRSAKHYNMASGTLLELRYLLPRIAGHFETSPLPEAWPAGVAADSSDRLLACLGETDATACGHALALFSTLASPRFCLPLDREACLLMTNALQRLVVALPAEAAAAIVAHERLGWFLATVGASGHTDLQRATQELVHTLLLHLNQGGDPHRAAVARLTAVVEAQIGAATAGPEDLELQGGRLAFYLRCLTPRPNPPSEFRIPGHDHLLVRSKRLSGWVCDLCHKQSSKDAGMLRFRCNSGCDFDVCGDCAPLKPGAQHERPVLSSATLDGLFALLGVTSFREQLDSSFRDLAFSIARHCDAQHLSKSASFWGAVRQAAGTTEGPPTPGVAAVVRRLAQDLATTVACRRNIMVTLQGAYQAIRVQTSQARLFGDLVSCLLGCFSPKLCRAKPLRVEDLRAMLALVATAVSRCSMKPQRSGGNLAARVWTVKQAVDLINLCRHLVYTRLSPGLATDAKAPILALLAPLLRHLACCAVERDRTSARHLSGDAGGKRARARHKRSMYPVQPKAPNDTGIFGWTAQPTPAPTPSSSPPPGTQAPGPAAAASQDAAAAPAGAGVGVGKGPGLPKETTPAAPAALKQLKWVGAGPGAGAATGLFQSSAHMDGNPAQQSDLHVLNATVLSLCMAVSELPALRDSLVPACFDALAHVPPKGADSLGLSLLVLLLASEDAALAFVAAGQPGLPYAMRLLELSRAGVREPPGPPSTKLKFSPSFEETVDLSGSHPAYALVAMKLLGALFEHAAVAPAVAALRGGVAEQLVATLVPCWELYPEPVERVVLALAGTGGEPRIVSSALLAARRLPPSLFLAQFQTRLLGIGSEAEQAARAADLAAFLMSHRAHFARHSSSTSTLADWLLEHQSAAVLGLFDRAVVAGIVDALLAHRTGDFAPVDLVLQQVWNLGRGERPCVPVVREPSEFASPAAYVEYLADVLQPGTRVQALHRILIKDEAPPSKAAGTDAAAPPPSAGSATLSSDAPAPAPAVPAPSAPRPTSVEPGERGTFIAFPNDVVWDKLPAEVHDVPRASLMVCSQGEPILVRGLLVTLNDHGIWPGKAVAIEDVAPNGTIVVRDLASGGCAVVNRGSICASPQDAISADPLAEQQLGLYAGIKLLYVLCSTRPDATAWVLAHMEAHAFASHNGSALFGLLAAGCDPFFDALRGSPLFPRAWDSLIQGWRSGEYDEHAAHCAEFWQLALGSPRVCQETIARFDLSAVSVLPPRPKGDCPPTTAFRGSLLHLARADPGLRSRIAAATRDCLPELGAADLMALLQLREERTVALRWPAKGTRLPLPYLEPQWLDPRQVLHADALLFRVPASWSVDTLSALVVTNPRLPKLHHKHAADSFCGRLRVDGVCFVAGAAVRLTSATTEYKAARLLVVLDASVWVQVRGDADGLWGILCLPLDTIRQGSWLLLADPAVPGDGADAAVAGELTLAELAPADGTPLELDCRGDATAKTVRLSLRRPAVPPGGPRAAGPGGGVAVVQQLGANGVINCLLLAARCNLREAVLSHRVVAGGGKFCDAATPTLACAARRLPLGPVAVKEVQGLAQAYEMNGPDWLDWLDQLARLVHIPGALELVLDDPFARDLIFTLCGFLEPHGLKDLGRDSPRAVVDNALHAVLRSNPDPDLRLECVRSGILASLLQRLSVVARLATGDPRDAADRRDGGPGQVDPWLLDSFLIAERAQRQGSDAFLLTPVTNGVYVNPEGEHVLKDLGPTAPAGLLGGTIGSAMKKAAKKVGGPPMTAQGLTSHMAYQPKPVFGMGAPAAAAAGHTAGPASADTAFACIRTASAIPRHLADAFYFEVEILHSGRDNMVAIGLHPDSAVSGMVGWAVGSFGYHGDDGTIRSSTASKKPVPAHQCTTGDVMGCGLNHAEGIVFFTKNGALVGGFDTTINRPLVPVVTGADQAQVRVVRDPAQFRVKNLARFTAKHLRGERVLETASAPARSSGKGYAGARWDVASHEAKQAEETARLLRLVRVLSAFFATSAAAAEGPAAAAELWADCRRLLDDSALCALLARDFANDSFTDMCKRSQYYLGLCRLVRAMASFPVTKHLVVRLERPLHSLMDIASAFLKLYADASRSRRTEAVELADEIRATVEGVRGLLQFGKAKEASAVDLGAQASRPEAYHRALAPRRMRAVGFLRSHTHHYSNLLAASMYRAATVARLAQEMADASMALPCALTNSIFIRVDAEHAEMLKVLITGSDGTPYESGCFEFDVYCPPEYPAVAPKVNLETTACGQVRFNPNLYSSGKVCLSLLGTWSGQGGEAWSTSSTLLQVFTSIQSLIMSEDVYFNEPGYERAQGTRDGQLRNEGYSNIVRYANVKYAILGQLQSPSPVFAGVIRRHLFYKKDEILAKCAAWVEAAQREPATVARYDGLVSSHNGILSAKFAASPTAYHDALKETVEELRALLSDLGLPSEQSDAEASSDSDSDTSSDSDN